MTSPRRLSRAPIIEMLIDFRVQARGDFNVAELKEVKDLLAADFPTSKQRHQFQMQVEGSGLEIGKAESRDLGVDGYFFYTADEKTIAQFRIDGLTLNRLAPYTSWEELLPKARELWALYAAKARPLRLLRLAVRSINQLLLPSDRVDDFVATTPRIPAGLDDTVTGFQTRVTTVDSKGISANTIQIMDPASDQHRNVLLDIDVFKVVDLAPSDPDIWNLLGELRAKKNAIFFQSITEPLARSFE
jgi:uncharacterized protein (TIGR04255 family)